MKDSKMGTSKFIMGLLLYITVITNITLTRATSVNRINYGISFQQLRSTKIVVSEFFYEFILTLPKNTIILKGETIPACNTNSRNKTQTHTGYKNPHHNDSPHTVDCSTALYSLMKLTVM